VAEIAAVTDSIASVCTPTPASAAANGPLAGTARETQRHQGRPQHQACAMGSRHQKRPHEKTGEPHLHAEAHAMTMAEAPVVKRPSD
jgi:hypothetical protein